MSAKPEKKSQEKEKRTDGKAHPIRVVPMHPGKAAVAAQAAAVNLTYRGGPLLTAVEVFTIFWSAAWEQSAESAVMNKMNQFFDYILTSPLMDQLGEYSVPGKAIGHGKRTGTTVITSPSPGTTVQDSAIQSMIQQGINAGTLPKTNANTLYFVFLPDGVTVEQGGSASCQAFCGYHDSFGNNIYYAAMPYPGCSGCTGGAGGAGCADVNEFARAVRGDYRSHSRRGMVRRYERRDWGYLRVEGEAAWGIHGTTGVVE